MYASVIGHGYNGGWPSSGGHIHRQFDWTGTHDPSAWFCVPNAIDAIAGLHSDGWAGIRKGNRAMCLKGRDLLVDVLGIDAPAPDEMIGSIAAVPVPDPLEVSNDIFDPLMIRLREKWSIEVPVFVWPEAPRRLLRISAQTYNSIDEYARLAEALAIELAS